MSGAKVRNSGEGKTFAQQTETNSSSYRPNVLTTFKDSAIADRAFLVRNDETTLVPQYLSALVPSKRAAFTKPSRGTSDSERRTIINGNRVFRFDCERCRLTRGAAFTLAEVLITLGIIGVVAAMTMPTLIQNHQKQVTVNRLKVAYSLFSQAVERSVQENGDIRSWKRSYTDMAPRYIFPYIETTGIVQKYPMYTTYSDKDKYGDRKFEFLYWGGWTSGKIYSLKNGMTYSLIYDWDTLVLTVDINGVKGPNRLGRDGFVFILDMETNELVPYNLGQTRAVLLKSCTKNGSWLYYDGRDCASLIISDGWQIKDDYPW